jgi:hypothetical protein
VKNAAAIGHARIAVVEGIAAFAVQDQLRNWEAVVAGHQYSWTMSMDAARDREGWKS